MIEALCRPATAAALPTTWDDVAPGHLVLARETCECGWWEAVVVEHHGDRLKLRYRDYPSGPDFVRHRSRRQGGAGRLYPADGRKFGAGRKSDLISPLP